MAVLTPQPVEEAQPRRQPLAVVPPRPSYKFIKVEDYFRDYQSWYRLDNVTSYDFDGKITLALHFQRNDERPCTMLLQFPRKDSIRVRFNPNNAISDDYTSYNTRTVVLDTLDQFIEIMEDVKVDPTYPDKSGNGTLQLTTKGEDGEPVLRVEVNLAPFKITVYDVKQNSKVWETARHGIYYAPNEDGDYSIIQAVDKPATAKFIGFGEQGGKELAKNTSQLNYFNFDNMRYRQVYDLGPFEDSEPLYHSDPFFMAFNGVPNKDNVVGIFVDNPSHVCMDIGSLNSARRARLLGHGTCTRTISTRLLTMASTLWKAGKTSATLSSGAEVSPEFTDSRDCGQGTMPHPGSSSELMSPRYWPWVCAAQQSLEKISAALSARRIGNIGLILNW